MSRKKKSLEEVKAALEKAQARVDALAQQEKELTAAQKAQERQDLLDAVMDWAKTMPQIGDAESVPEITALFRRWKQKNILRQEQKGDAIGGARPQEMPPAGRTD